MMELSFPSQCYSSGLLFVHGDFKDPVGLDTPGPGAFQLGSSLFSPPPCLGHVFHENLCHFLFQIPQPFCIMSVFLGLSQIPEQNILLSSTPGIAPWASLFSTWLPTHSRLFFSKCSVPSVLLHSYLFSPAASACALFQLLIHNPFLPLLWPCAFSSSGCALVTFPAFSSPADLFPEVVNRILNLSFPPGLFMVLRFGSFLVLF